MSDEPEPLNILDIEVCGHLFSISNAYTPNYYVDGRLVSAEVYDRVLATARAGAADVIAEHLDSICDALNENENGKHPRSLVDAIADLAASISAK